MDENTENTENEEPEDDVLDGDIPDDWSGDSGSNNTDVLPRSLANNLGKTKVAKGTAGQGLIKLYSWDAVQDCTRERCPARDTCEFVENSRIRKCAIQLSYLRGCTEMIFKNYSDVLDEPMLYQIGIHLMPLYKNLCKLKIEELGVSQAVTQNTKSGRDQINPIYKEIREHIKIIQMMWRDIGLKSAQLPPPNLDKDDFKTT